MNRLAASLVIETNNLLGGSASASRVGDSLAPLLHHLRSQTYPLHTLREVVVTHAGLSEGHRDALQATLGRPIRFVELGAGVGYYDAKNAGFESTSAEVVAFGDGDCWPADRWLEELLQPFERDPQVQVVAGRTTYRDDLLGTAATAIDFMYFHGPWGDPGLTRNFYANNVAFRRSTFAAHPYEPVEGVYRGHCQILGTRLRRAGVPIHFQPSARTVHRFPDSAAEFVRLRLHRGADAVQVTPHLAATYLPGSLGWVARLPAVALLTLGVRLGFSMHALGRQDMPEVRGLRRGACRAAIAGLTALDALGAAAESVGVHVSGRGDLGSLSYHRDIDRLADRQAA